MAEAIRMPLLSDTMKEGVIAEWHKKVGDTVKSDDVIAEVETDKATMEVMPYVDGTLLYISEKGKGVPINGIMAIIGKPGEDIQGILDAEKNQGGQPAAQGAPAAQQPAAQQPAAQQPAAPQQAAPQQEAAPQAAAPQQQPEPAAASSDERVKASPLAKKLAQDKGVDIQQVKGSGDQGRIIKRDIDSYQPQQGGAAAQPQKGAMPAIQPVVVGQEGYTDTPVSQMRSIIAQRLAESKFSAPHFYLNISVTMDGAIAARKSITELWMGTFIRQNQHIHIGTAVAVEDGLLVPVVRFADQKSLSQISSEAGALIEKARNKKLQPNEFKGNTFTISNLGMMDIDDFTAIINPPDACILAVGKIAPTPVVENNQVVVRQIMKLTLSCDHRVVDGAVGARFLQTLKAHLENPVTMLV
jgi:pyruvate dehydrogenase E2 component (dihydrolipoamide acetyltransferase)